MLYCIHLLAILMKLYFIVYVYSLSHCNPDSLALCNKCCQLSLTSIEPEIFLLLKGSVQSLVLTHNIFHLIFNVRVGATICNLNVQGFRCHPLPDSCTKSVRYAVWYCTLSIQMLHIYNLWLCPLYPTLFLTDTPPSRRNRISSN